MKPPSNPAAATALVGKTIPYFEPAEPAADRRGTTRPLGSLRIVAARLSDSGRTLTLATDPHPVVARYLLPMPIAPVHPAAKASEAGATNYDLSGIEAAWTPEASADDRPAWTGWWPSLDLERTRKLTRGSKRHEDELALLSRPGRLALGAFVRLPVGRVTVRIESSQPIDEVSIGDAQGEATAPTTPAEPYRFHVSVPSQGDAVFLSITCRTGANGRPLTLNASYRSATDRADHAIEREQTILPWAPVPTAGATAPVQVPDLAGGDPARGQAIFQGEKARCSQCHTFRGQGSKVGPDLTDIGKKGRAEIYRAIAAPSAAIEPDFASFSVATKNGQVVVGVVRAEGADAIRVTDTNAHATTIPRQEIDQIRPSANSIMPVGLTGALGDAAVRDLIAFLTTDPLPVSGATSSRPTVDDTVRAPALVTIDDRRA